MPTPRPVRSPTLVALLVASSLTPACGLQDQPTAPAPAELPTHLDETLPHGSISISRTWEGPGAREALRIAEAAYPDPDSILAAVEGRRFGREDEARASEMVRRYGVSGARWWLEPGDEVLVPFAITRGAVEHALDRAREIRARMAEGGPDTTTVLDSDRNPVETLVIVPRVTMIYEAHARAEPRVEVGGERMRDVVVVKMRLSFSKYCGLLCEFGFYAERTVYVSSGGRVLRIEGDGRPFLTVA